jgi:hypothetical protein
MSVKLPNKRFLRIDQMYAFVSVGKDGDEGIIGSIINGQYMPLVGADMERVESLRPYAQHAANQAGITVKLCLFSERKEVETIKPKQS